MEHNLMAWAYAGRTPGSVVSPWATSNYVVNAFCLFDGPGDSGELYVGDESGNVYEMDQDYPDDATLITKDYDSGDPFKEILIDYVIVIAKSKSATAGQINMQFVIDQVLDTSLTVQIPKSGDLPSTYTLYFISLQGIKNAIHGSKIGLKFWPNVPNKHFAIQCVKLHGELVPILKQFEV
jgi:hypothetical protein